MHRTISIVSTYLNCHEYILFVVVFSLLDCLVPGSEFLVCLQPAIDCNWFFCLYDNQRQWCIKVKEGDSLIQASLLVYTSDCFRLFFLHAYLVKRLVSQMLRSYTHDSAHESISIGATTACEQLKSLTILNVLQLMNRRLFMWGPIKCHITIIHFTQKNLST